jgi:hypothetical protein
MTERTRFPLKQPTGWFAAGREVACALELLSDANGQGPGQKGKRSARRRAQVRRCPPEPAAIYFGKVKCD